MTVGLPKLIIWSILLNCWGFLNPLWPICTEALCIIQLLDGSATSLIVSQVLMPMWPVCSCGLPMRGSCAWAWNFGPVTFDRGAMTLTLGILWMLLCPRCWCQCGQLVHVDYLLGVDVHGHECFVLLPLTLEPCPWDDPPMAGPSLTWSVF